MPSNEKETTAGRRAKSNDGTSSAASRRAGNVAISSGSSRPGESNTRSNTARAASSAGTGGGGYCVPILGTKYCLDPPLYRPIPDMSIHPNECKESVLRATADQTQNNTSLRRFVEAYKLMDTIDDRLVNLDNPNQRMKLLMHKVKMWERAHENCVDVSLLSSNDAYLGLCVDLLRCITLTDWRLAFTGGVVHALPLPECAFHITSPNLPAGDTDIQLHHLGCKEFLVLLVAAIATRYSPNLRRTSLHLVHELRVHAACNYEWLDWTDLDQVKGSDGVAITEADARFALATVAVKVCRDVYRNGLGEDPALRGGYVRPEPSKEDLLTSIEVFAKDQCRYRPTSGVGYFNRGWVLSQAPALRGVNAIEASADAFEVMTKAYELADADEDDFVRSAGRIEAAACLFMGGGGVVGLANKNNMVVRDMRSQEVKLADGTIERDRMTLPNGESGNSEQRKFHKRCRISAKTTADEDTIFRNEQDRISNNIPDTFLFPFENLFVEPWEVKRLWNQAVQPLDALASWNHSHCVYGECWGWDSVVMLVKASDGCPPNQYANACRPPGFPIKTDAGREGFRDGSLSNGPQRNEAMRRPCNWCGKNGFDLMRCTQCKATYYCDATCQKGHWKKGGHKAECKKAV